MKVLHVLPFISARTGGPAAFVAQSSDALAAVGVDATIVSTNLGQVPRSGAARTITSEELPDNVERLDLEMFAVNTPKRLAYSRKMGSRLDELIGDFDLVHIHSLWLYPQFAAQRAARKHSVPYVVSPHGALDPYLRRRGRPRKWLTTLLWQRRMFRSAAAIHVTTDEERRLITDIVGDAEMHVVPIGIWTEKFREIGNAGRFREQFLGSGTGPVILFLGRVTHKKGLDLLIQSFAKVTGHPDAFLVVAGPDDEALLPSLVDLAKRLGVEDRVRFVGAVYGETRADALAAADVWALTSYTENFGIAVIEAMAAGLPTMVSTEVNLAPTIAAHDAGEVVSLDADEIGRRLTHLLESESRRVELSANAQDYVKQFDWAQVAPRLKAMYESAINA